MKFDIVIKDASAEDLNRLVAALGGLDTPREYKNHAEPEIAQQNAVAAASYVHTPAILPSVPALPVAIEGATAAPALGNAEVDSSGLPYDGRIHSSAKGFTKDGLWKKRRGVSELETEKVEAELRGIEIDVPNVPSVPVMLDVPPAPPTLPAAPALPTLPSATAVARDFNGVLTRIQSGFQQGKMNAEGIQQLCKLLNVASITDINGSQPHIDAAHQTLDASGL